MMGYLIVGRTGEYNDRRNWNVIVYSNKEKAQIHLDNLNNWCKENKVDMERAARKVYLEKGFKKRKEMKCPYDDNFSFDYISTEYNIKEVELIYD